MTRLIRSNPKEPVSEERTRPGPVYRPEADILERPEAYQVLVDLPGVDEEGVTVNFDKDVLRIEANPSAGPHPDWNPRHLEYQPGGYAREFRISEGIQVDRIEASLKNGVLELRLPKTAHRRPRTIQVAAS